MAGLRPRFEKGPLTFQATTVANGGNIKAGTFVEFDGTTGKVKPATAASAKVLGLAIGDTAASDFANANTTDTWGNPVVNAHTPPNEVAVAYQGVWDVEVEDAAVNPGDLIAVGLTGLATVAGATPAEGVVIGRSVSAAAVAIGSKVRVRLAVI